MMSMGSFEELPPAVQENVLRVLVEAEEAAKAAGNPLELSLDEVVELMRDWSTLGVHDMTFKIPLGLVGVWRG
jgi:hypothetical protein